MDAYRQKRFAVLWCLLLTACDCGGGATGGTCVTDVDCPGQLCVDRVCVSLPDASADAGSMSDLSFSDIPFPDVPAPDSGPPSMDADTCAELSLEFSGEPTLLDLPVSARYLVFKAWGAGGNGDGGRFGAMDSIGGPGGYSAATYEVMDPGPLTVVVGERGRNNGEMAFGFAPLGGGGLSGLFMGSPPLVHTEQERALLVAGGGGSGVRNGGAHGGAGNDVGGMPTMLGGQATFTGPNNANAGTGGGGGYFGGIGRRNNSTGGLGGSGFGDTPEAMEAAERAGLRLIESLVLSSSSNLPPRQDDEEYPDMDCPVGTQECNGFVVVRILCDEPPELL